jgi:hypothetical protein
MSVICTLYEGNYHLGLGALVNSLYAQGFRGHFYAGYRGDVPPWAERSVRKNGTGWLFDVNGDCTLHFVPVATQTHFNNYKPHFLLELMEKLCPQEQNFFFFDPDIVVKAPWSFFERWVSHGIAVCEDLNHYLPRNHPVRLAWKEYAAACGLSIRQEIDKFYNGGFFGVRQDHQDFLQAWKNLFECRARDGVDLRRFELSGFEFPYLYLDQDLMNLALMLVAQPISAVGPEGMDFTPGGQVMSHSAGATKSWRKKFVWEALNGSAPSRADKEFIRHTQSPIRIFSTRQLTTRRVGVMVGSAIGRFYRRNNA